jgi:uncharacterized protein YndB with AHSA1/START domain
MRESAVTRPIPRIPRVKGRLPRTSRTNRRAEVATVHRFIRATPAEVFARLADGWCYSNWVVGTSHIRAVDSTWPAVGSKIHHAVGAWPAVMRDETTVDNVEPNQLLVLTAKGRPLGEARVVIELAAEGTATRVTMHETPVAGPGKWTDSKFTQSLIARRNVEALARLAATVERRTAPLE